MSPVHIDPTKEVPLPSNQRNIEKGVPLELTPAQKATVVLTKYISTDTHVADWEPEGEWFEQVVVDIGRRRRNRNRPRITINGLDGEKRGVNRDDGLIIDIVGTLTRVVGIVPGQPPMDEAAMDAFEDQNEGQPVPTYQQWDFRVVGVLKTNGPEGRENLSRSEEQKRLNAQTEMYDAIRDAFTQGMGAMFSQGKTAPTAKEVIEAGSSIIQQKAAEMQNQADTKRAVSGAVEESVRVALEAAEEVPS